ncbi:putative UbiE/COQ5 family methyltransferase [Aspergillus homomorphus CBS 101889]|uniref:Arsenite methyltransferase n=1 Tax=Aspergillus homomorphus (strain CBS 101889) TaxID=1450537 RepID=A0A395IBH9_ASPHC|nr:putative UbiE/COQ5 family methyltransferase [Aspergillus homomorphus CBS 101889]RAL17406.1 putative UbiE/COQ5 family methyltransferase [Aspergillus homomorphus CBS 101889]
MNPEDTYCAVQDRYASVASQTSPNPHKAYERKVATAFGYAPEDLLSIPERANLGVSCGNPVAMASIQTGETVVDLGSGGGIDVLLAAKKVGLEGKAIGVDMTTDMIELGRNNATRAGAANVSFVEARITSIPLSSATVDCILSNCVVNLVPETEKPLVFREMFRLLKPSGRVAISDILAKRELPMEIKTDLSLYVGCVAGASQVRDYEKWLRAAGFEDIVIVNTNNDLNIYKELYQGQETQGLGPRGSCCDPTMQGATGQSKATVNVDFNYWTGSFTIFAVKPDKTSA